ncbi:MAG: response regulator transcription factor [Flavobacteriales bacterium]|jgi:DNA-binding NarL/FixJ family response regulator|nr:response regulator transcription factor [Flavobacteriales bacterium]
MLIENIVIADQHYLVLEGLRAILSGESHRKVVATACNKQELHEAFTKSDVDLLIFDPFSISFHTFHDVAQLRRIRPKCRLMVVTDKTDRPRILEVLEMGVSSFITKSCEREEILEAIDAIERGEKFYCHKILDVVVEHESGCGCAAAVLSRREQEIVQRICEGYKTQEIAEQLNISVHTINTHRKKVLKKLGLRTPNELIRYAIGTSLVEVDTATSI